MGKNPIFIYCCLCRKTVFYPLAHWLTGTNICLKCNARLGCLPKPIAWLKKQILRVYYQFKHDWYVEKGFVPYNLKEPSSIVLRCGHCCKDELVKKGTRENEVIQIIETLCRIRNVLRGKS